MYARFCDIYSPRAEKKRELKMSNKSIEFNIRIYQDEEGIFAEITTEDGNHVCVADGKDDYDAIKEVCLVLMDILDWHNEERSIS